MKNTLYEWHGKNAYGQWISGEILAFSINLALAKLQKNHIQVISIQKKRKPFLSRKITAQDINAFFRQLATLVTSAIPLTHAIQILLQNTTQKKLGDILLAIKNDITSGTALSKSLQKFPLYFDQITCTLVYAGEQSGTLHYMLERIAQHQETAYALKNKIRQALFYPMLISMAAMIVTIIMLTFVIPHFAILFQNAHTPLPILTSTVIQIADFLRQNILTLLIAFTLLTVLLIKAKDFPRMRKILVAAPVIGTLLQKFILGRWARNLATLFAAGIPLTNALKILENSIGCSFYRLLMEQLYLTISAGKQLHLAMQNSKMFPILMVQMIQIGEESGTLEKMLTKIADFYESDLDRTIGYVSRLLEPLIMSILGVVIGGLVIAMYLPIFKLGAVI